MNLEEYQAADEKIKTQVEELIQAKHELDDQYIAENRMFQDGQRVTVKWAYQKWVEAGFIERAKIGREDAISYAVLKIKKDGTPSKKYVDYSGDCGIMESRISAAEAPE